LSTSKTISQNPRARATPSGEKKLGCGLRGAVPVSDWVNSGSSQWSAGEESPPFANDVMVGTLRSSGAWYLSRGRRLIAVKNVTNLLIYIV